MLDLTGFMANTTKLSALIKSNGEGGGGGLISCTDSGMDVGIWVQQFLKN